ncbi:tRNA (N6-isopentenyl adenosine(37)-C2)-methylthiotransferase MiaB [Candidatus Aerophobetes bacterium]|nr:tRNA (N6-isopentenyl adenosine(37)-C2)-methylthiotransferase MiaB [Candidatus Aerophobetes bacterium]
MPYLYIKTYGCQMNEYDSEVIAGLLFDKGYRLSYNLESADLIVVNTCYVREKVKQKVLSFLGELKKIKEKKDVIIGIGGCLVQKDPQEIAKRAPFVDFLFGTLNLHRLPLILEKLKTYREKLPLIEVEEDKNLPDSLPVLRKKNFSCFIPVIRGCNNFCSYCNVPYVRGREKSRPLPIILEEVKEAVKKGAKEVVLLGQNVNSYGKDLPEKVDFAHLLSEVNKIEGVKWIRFLTSHPKDISERLIRKIAELEKVCEHLHLPLQSGSNRILKLMRRGYTREKYLEIVEKVREAVPDITITTDIIVGFPGEEEKDFEDTLDMIRKVKFDGAFTFEFSPLPGTLASSLEKQVPREVKRRRLRELIKLQQEILEEKNKELVGKVEEVLVEDVSPKNEKELQGKTRGAKTVVFPADKTLIGNFVKVRIEKAGCWALRGKLL